MGFSQQYGSFALPPRWQRGLFSGDCPVMPPLGSHQGKLKGGGAERWPTEEFFTDQPNFSFLQHDDREGEGGEKWANRGRGRGIFPRGRGRFLYRKSSTSPKWAHDKFSGEEGEIEDDESGAENREDKDALQSVAE